MLLIYSEEVINICYQLPGLPTHICAPNLAFNTTHTHRGIHQSNVHRDFFPRHAGRFKSFMHSVSLSRQHMLINLQQEVENSRRGKGLHEEMTPYGFAWFGKS